MHAVVIKMAILSIMATIFKAANIVNELPFMFSVIKRHSSSADHVRTRKKPDITPQMIQLAIIRKRNVLDNLGILILVEYLMEIKISTERNMIPMIEISPVAVVKVNRTWHIKVFDVMDEIKIPSAR